MATKVKVIKDVTVYDRNRTYGLGAVFDYSGGEESVEKLVKLGIVEKVAASSGSGKNEGEKPPKEKADTPEKTEAEKAFK